MWTYHLHALVGERELNVAGELVFEGLLFKELVSILAEDALNLSATGSLDNNFLSKGELDLLVQLFSVDLIQYSSPVFLISTWGFTFFWASAITMYRSALNFGAANEMDKIVIPGGAPPHIATG